MEQPTEDQHEDKPDVILPGAPRQKNDRKFLFFIIAVLALLLIAGAIYHYSSASYDDEDLADEPADTAVAKDIPDAETAKAPVTYNPKKPQQVVVNGEGVVKKGTKLECVGENGDWYEVVYMNKRYYMSKQFTYLVE